MSEITPLERTEFKIDTDEKLHKFQSARLSRINDNSTAEKIIRTVILFIFTYVYFIFGFVYLFEYKSDLMNIQMNEGTTNMIKSKIFWNFQRDLFIMIAGYILLHILLKRIMFTQTDQ